MPLIVSDLMYGLDAKGSDGQFPLVPAIREGKVQFGRDFFQRMVWERRFWVFNSSKITTYDPPGTLQRNEINRIEAHRAENIPRIWPQSLFCFHPCLSENGRR